MDQDSTKGTDKRNWRERLGIGTGSTPGASKELPKIAETYTPAPKAEAKPLPVAPRAPTITKAAVKPAPMAPRAAPRAPAAAEPEKLAEKLRSQREASAKLAEQRVQVAKQRAEAAAAQAPAKTNGQVPHTNGAAGPKPKFTFAEDDGSQAQAQRPVAQPIAPARPPLGAAPTPAFTPRPQPPQPNPYVAQPPLTPRAVTPPAYQPMPGAIPGYRPIDPATGYAPLPQSPFPQQRPPFQQGYGQQPLGPRLNMPQRPPMGAPQMNPPGYAPQPMPPQMPQGDYGMQAPVAPEQRPQPGRFGRPGFTPRVAPQPQPRLDHDEDHEQFFDEAPPPPRAGQRRPAADYQQAYREIEPGFEDEHQKSSGPWILLGLLLLALAIAGASVWYYQRSIKPMMNTTQSSQQEQVPVVAAPADPAKVEPEPAPAQAATSKKRIYDRIVGDQEVLGGDILPSEEAPLAPNLEATDAEPQPLAPSGDDAQPLPIPPPPGDGNTQGSLDTEDPAKQSAELESPAAGASQAAVAAPAPGEFVEPASAPASEAEVATQVASESIADPTPVPAPVKKAVAKPKKLAAQKVAEKSLGAKPVVLVPAKKKQATAKRRTNAASNDDVETDVATGDDLYGAEAGEVTAIAEVPQKPQAAAPKKRTLADLFQGSDGAEANDVQTAANDPVEAAPLAPAKKVAAPKPAPEPVQVAQAGGYLAQLASFRSREEANSEFSRLRAKHSAALRGSSPVITQAEVAGTTRYRLSVGGMASRDEATAFCSKLFAAGERDCLVRKQ